MPSNDGVDWVLALDPGEQTGWALARVGNDERPETGTLRHYEMGRLLENTLDYAHNRAAVVCERFDVTTQTSRKKPVPWSLEMIGLARYLARRYECEFELQNRSTGLRFGSDEQLRKLGWYVPGRRHENDAQAHLLTFLATRGYLHTDWRDKLFTPVNEQSEGS